MEQNTEEVLTEKEEKKEQAALFANISPLGEKELKALARLSFAPAIILLVVFFVIFIGLGFLWLFVLDSLEFAIFCFAFGILFAIIYPFLLKFNMKRANQAFMQVGKIFSRYEFAENSFKVESQKREGDADFTSMGLSIVNYSSLQKMVVTNDYIFLYVSRMQCFIVGTDGMTEGGVEELITLLKSKIKTVQDKRKRAK